MEKKDGYKVEVDTKALWIKYLMARRDALCRELAEVESQLGILGKPVKNPKVVIDKCS